MPRNIDDDNTLLTLQDAHIYRAKYTYTNRSRRRTIIYSGQVLVSCLYRVQQEGVFFPTNHYCEKEEDIELTIAGRPNRLCITSSNQHRRK